MAQPKRANLVRPGRFVSLASAVIIVVGLSPCPSSLAEDVAAKTQPSCTTLGVGAPPGGRSSKSLTLPHGVITVRTYCLGIDTWEVQESLGGLAEAAYTEPSRLHLEPNPEPSLAPDGSIAIGFIESSNASLPYALVQTALTNVKVYELFTISNHRTVPVPLDGKVLPMGFFAGMTSLHGAGFACAESAQHTLDVTQYDWSVYGTAKLTASGAVSVTNRIVITGTVFAGSGISLQLLGRVTTKYSTYPEGEELSRDACTSSLMT